ncbi:MAG: DUF262 domain-containing protein [Nocardioides alkalitolerans]
METFKRTPLQLFNLPQHFVIPLFQRPYVWKEGEQWEPLWKDVRRVAELRINEPHLAPQHFLGAVVPPGHTGEVVDPQTKAQDWVEIKHLVEAGLLPAGTVIRSNHRDFKEATAVVTADGFLELDGKRFSSPSGAGRHLRKKATNGWYVWALEDGRRLRDARAQFMSGVSDSESE